MKHRHIKYSDPNWRSNEWECVCGYKVDNFKDFDLHLAEKDKNEVKDKKIPE